MNKYFLFAFLLFGLVWSCSDSELYTPGDEFLSGGIATGTYQVELNGTLWKFDKTTQAYNNPSQSEVNGAGSTGNTISIRIPQSLSTGNYSESDEALVMMMLNNGVYSNMDGAGNFLPFNLSITSVDNSSGQVSGKFSGTVSNIATGETITLTNGIFVKIHFIPTTDSDWKLKADFNGEGKDFSTNARAEGITTAAMIVGENQNQAQTLSITIPGGLSEGTFTEEDEVKVQVNLGTTTNPSDVYTNYDPTTDTYLPATLKITSITLGDGNSVGVVKGNFSGIITKFINGVPGEEVEVTSGEIKVPIIVQGQD